MKALHWEKLKAAADGTVWKNSDKLGQPKLNFDELESMFQILEITSAISRKVASKGEEVRLVEHRRAHNICIELSGIRKPFPAIKAALLSMDDSDLSVEQLQALSRAVPNDQERRDIEDYLAGRHPKYKGVSDPLRLGTVERYFVEIRDIPRLQERIICLIFMRTYQTTREMCQKQLNLVTNACRQLCTCEAFLKLLQAVLELGNHLNAGTQRGSAAGFRLDALLKLADVKAIDRRTSLLQFVVRQLLADDPSVENMAKDMKDVRPAATMQLSAVTSMISELRSGLRAVEIEVDATKNKLVEALPERNEGHADVKEADGEDSDADRRFLEALTSFHASASDNFASLEKEESAAFAFLKSTTEYFGEGFVPADPMRIISVVRDFVFLFERALLQEKARIEDSAKENKSKTQFGKTATSDKGMRVHHTSSTGESTHCRETSAELEAVEEVSDAVKFRRKSNDVCPGETIVIDGDTKEAANMSQPDHKDAPVSTMRKCTEKEIKFDKLCTASPSRITDSNACLDDKRIQPVEAVDVEMKTPVHAAKINVVCFSE